jgi:nitric oxide dioxygenase
MEKVIVIFLTGLHDELAECRVMAYAEHIADPTVLLPVVDRISQKHVSLDIRPEHYIIVGKHLIASIQEVLGKAATADIVEAWDRGL